MKSRIIIVTLMLALSPALYADDNPQAKVDMNSIMQKACADRQEGDLCDFQNASGDSISGQCKRNGASNNNTLQCIANGS